MTGAPHPLLARMKGDVPSALWPPVFSNDLASLAALIHALDRTQWLSPAEIAAGQARQLRVLAAHFAAHSPHFRARLADAGLAADALDPAGLGRLAPLTRREVQAAGDGLHCPLPPGHAPASFGQSSGSTGEPVRIRKGKMCQLFWLAMTVRCNLWHEGDPAGRLAALRVMVDRDAVETPTWGGPMDRFFETGPMLVLSNALDLADQAARLAAFAPDSLVVYPSNLAGLIETMAPLPGLKRIRTIGETLPPDLRAAAGAHFGAGVKDCYSSEEFGYLAIECPESGLYHLMSEALIVELVGDDGAPCREGEAGRVLVTDLHNFAMPMIRYDIGDRAEAGPLCPCGRGLPTLRRILGRERNLVMKPDGTTAWPVTGFREVREVAPIVQFQFVQTSLEEIEIRMVVERALSGEEEGRLVALVRRALGHPFRLRFVYVPDRLPRAASGKFEEFMRAF